MGNDGPLLTCMEVEVVGAVWMVDVVPGRLVTANTGFSASWKRRNYDNSDKPLDLVNICPQDQTRLHRLYPHAKPYTLPARRAKPEQQRGVACTNLKRLWHEESQRELSVNLGYKLRATQVP